MYGTLEGDTGDESFLEDRLVLEVQTIELRGQVHQWRRDGPQRHWLVHHRHRNVDSLERLNYLLSRRKSFKTGGVATDAVLDPIKPLSVETHFLRKHLAFPGTIMYVKWKGIRLNSLFSEKSRYAEGDHLLDDVVAVLMKKKDVECVAICLLILDVSIEDLVHHLI